MISIITLVSWKYIDLPYIISLYTRCGKKRIEQRWRTIMHVAVQKENKEESSAAYMKPADRGKNHIIIVSLYIQSNTIFQARHRHRDARREYPVEGGATTSF